MASIISNLSLILTSLLTNIGSVFTLILNNDLIMFILCLSVSACIFSLAFRILYQATRVKHFTDWYDRFHSGKRPY